MSEERNHYMMPPMSGEKVEVDGVYKTEWGREEELKRGDTFPADPVMGNTEWVLTELKFDNHHEGKTDPRLIPKSDNNEKQKVSLSSPRHHIDSGDK
ncbi:transposase [Paenibacillus tarimensis]